MNLRLWLSEPISQVKLLTTVIVKLLVIQFSLSLVLLGAIISSLTFPVYEWIMSDWVWKWANYYFTIVEVEWIAGWPRLLMNETEIWFWCEEAVESCDVHEDRMHSIDNFAASLTLWRGAYVILGASKQLVIGLGLHLSSFDCGNRVFNKSHFLQTSVGQVKHRVVIDACCESVFSKQSGCTPRNSRITGTGRALSSNRKIPGSCLSRAEPPLSEWGLHIIPSCFHSNKPQSKGFIK